jgi:hypothetical protein
MMRVVVKCLIFFTGFIFLGCRNCSDEVTAEITSPDATLSATSFVRDCGATTAYSSIVSVHKKSAGFRDDNEIVFVANGRHDLAVSWIGPRVLSIRCNSCMRKDIFRQVTVLGHIDVAFELGPAPLNEK